MIPDSQSYNSEIIPTGSVAAYLDIEVKEALTKKHLMASLPPKSFSWKYFVRFGPILLIALLAFTWSQPMLRKDDMLNSDLLSFLLKTAGLEDYRALVIEGFVNFLCWSTTNLFIRRLLNPETSDGAIERFFADAIFGGIAAGAQIVMKIILLKKIL